MTYRRWLIPIANCIRVCDTKKKLSKEINWGKITKSKEIITDDVQVLKTYCGFRDCPCDIDGAVRFFRLQTKDEQKNICDYKKERLYSPSNLSFSK